MAWNREKERKAGKAMTIGSCVYGLIFSIVWCVLAASMGAGFMLLFGIPFAIFMLFRLIICIQYAKEDPTASPKSCREEPWERPQPTSGTAASGYCPYCGTQTQDSFDFCPKCGRRLAK